MVTFLIVVACIAGYGGGIGATHFLTNAMDIDEFASFWMGLLWPLCLPAAWTYLKLEKRAKRLHDKEVLRLEQLIEQDRILAREGL